MTAKWMPSIVKPIWDKLVSLIEAQSVLDDITVGEIIAGLHGDLKRMKSSGIYVLSPGMTNEDVAAGDPESWEDAYDFPVYCFVKGFTEAKQYVAIADIVGVVVDAVRGDSTLSGLAQASYVTEVSRPEIEQGEGVAPGAVHQLVMVRVQIAYD